MCFLNTTYPSGDQHNGSMGTGALGHDHTRWNPTCFMKCTHAPVAIRQCIYIYNIYIYKITIG